MTQKPSPFQKVAILGGGLLGGSIAYAIRDSIPDAQVSLWGRRSESVKAFLKAGFQGSSDIAEVIASADLILLATPVGGMRFLAEKIVEIGVENGTLVTDVGSVKRSVHEYVGRLLSENGIDFIGSHPIAGSEQSGFLAATASLLRDSLCILTNEESVSQKHVDRLCFFWKSLGMKMKEMRAEDHDTKIARVSHLPHVLAALCAKVGLENGNAELADLCGGGMHDTTRIAAGSPEMWTEILLENAEALRVPLSECLQELNDVLAKLESSDQEGLRLWLQEAKEACDQLPPRCLKNVIP